jgi:pimeloyl-ACP methyl ester carboxylesterase
VIFQALQHAGHALLYAQGFRERHIAIGGRRCVAYDRAGRGTGPPIVLIHGLGGSATSWVALASRLLPLCRRVRLLDLPGHGRAQLGPSEPMAEGLDLLQAVGVALVDLAEPSVLIGNSLGGALALGSAIFLPERVLGVIGLSPAGAPLRPVDRDELKATFRSGHAGGMELGRRLYHRPPLGLALLARDLGLHFGGPQIQALLDEAPPGNPLLPLEELSRLTMPRLVVWGASDRVLPRASVDFFREALGPTHVEVWEETGHVAQMEHPVRVAQRVARFLKEVSG